MYDDLPKEIFALINYGKRRGFIAGVAFSVATYCTAKLYVRGMKLEMERLRTTTHS